MTDSFMTAETEAVAKQDLTATILLIWLLLTGGKRGLINSTPYTGISIYLSCTPSTDRRGLCSDDEITTCLGAGHSSMGDINLNPSWLMMPVYMNLSSSYMSESATACR